jgi:hypothetical protein
MRITRTVIPVSEWPSKKPCIGYDNLLARVADFSGTFVASADDGVHTKENLIDGKEFTYWNPGTSGTHYVGFTAPAAQEVNYVALHGHTMVAAGTTVNVKYKSGGTWYTAASAVPTHNGPLMISFAPILSSEWRIEFVSSAAFFVAIAYIGRSVVMERGCWTGLTPPWMGRVAESITSVSESGSLLGRSFRRKGVRFEMDFDFITQDFIRGEWMPFVLHAESLPFFVQWNSLDFPSEAAFCWVNDASKDFAHPRFTGPTLMSCAVSCTGRVE